jgi:hypothetical protein
VVLVLQVGATQPVPKDEVPAVVATVVRAAPHDESGPAATREKNPVHAGRGAHWWKSWAGAQSMPRMALHGESGNGRSKPEWASMLCLARGEFVIKC